MNEIAARHSLPTETVSEMLAELLSETVIEILTETVAQIGR